VGTEGTEVERTENTIVPESPHGEQSDVDIGQKPAFEGEE
jgi:hypothetical protein